MMHHDVAYVRAVHQDRVDRLTAAREAHRYRTPRRPRWPSWRPRRRAVRWRSVLVVLVGLLAAVPLAFAEGGSASSPRIEQEVPMRWHPQSGSAGEVADGATASLVRTREGIRYRIDTSGLVPGHAYSVWFVVVNDPAGCTAVPCAGPQFIGDATVDGQVSWGRDGRVGRADGTARFGARIEAGPLLDGWLRVQGLDDPMQAEIHLVLNDHGPVVDGLRREMLSTYRAGCSDASPFPAFFPPSALADGTPGPNICRLHQTAVFTAPEPAES